MLKHLRKLLLLAALLVPWATQAQTTTCDLTFYMYDEYGDGWYYWSGSSGDIYVYVYQDDSLVGAVTLSNGSYGEANVTVSGSSPVVLICQGNDGYSESSFTLDGFSELTDVYLYNYDTGDTIAVLETPCPSCPSPTGVTVLDVLTDGFTLSWNGSATASSFNIYLNDSLIDQVSDTFYVYTGLNANTVYQAGVRSICGDDDSSTLKTVSVKTACTAFDSLPWHDDLELAAGQNWNSWFEAPCWNFLTNATSYPYVYVYDYSGDNHTPGGSKSIYWTCDSYYANYNCLILPSFDTETIPINSVQLTFWAKSGYSSYQPKLMIGVLSDINDISTFDTVAEVTVNQDGSASWEEIIVSFGNYEGEGTRLAVRGDYTGSYWYGYFDDFTIEEIPNCPPVKQLTVDVTTAGAAIATWDIQPNVADPSEYSIVYGPLDGSEDPTEETTLDQHFTLQDLTPGTQYFLKVQAVCDDDNGNWDSITFMTKGFNCIEMDENSLVSDTIGEGGNTNSYMPCYHYYPGMSQQIYTKEELGTSFAITSLSFQASTLSVSPTYQIYLGHTSSTSLSSFQLPSDMVKVYEGTPVLTQNSWCEFVLDQVFNYDTALGNLSLIVAQNDMPYDYNYFYVHTNPNGYCMYGYNYNGTIDPTNPSTLLYSYTTSYRNNIVFNGGDCLQLASCSAPAVTPVYVTSDTVIVNWIPGYDETEWDLDYMVEGDTGWTNVASGITDWEYAFANLNSNTLYNFRVSHTCDEEVYSATCKVRTDCGLMTSLPFVEDFEMQNTTSYNSKSFIPCWGLTTDATDYPYCYVSNSSTYNHTPGGNKGVYVYWTTGGSYYGTYKGFVLPGVDTTIYPVNKLMLTFWARNPYNYMALDMVVGAMSDPSDENSFVAMDTISIPSTNTNWTKYTVRYKEFTADTCIYLAVRVYNFQDINSYGYLYIDDITLSETPPCDPVEDIEVVTSAASAIVSWTSFGNYQGATVEYLDTIDNVWYSTTVTGQDYAILSNLYSAMPYLLQVTAVCSGDTLAPTVSSEFKTKGFACAVVNDSLTVIDTIGNGTSTSAYLPNYVWYNYAISQQIYTAAELGSGGSITALSVMSSSAPNVRDIEIYLAHTSSSSLNSFEHPSDMIKVWGEAQPSFVDNQWYTFTFDQPFNYNGSDNLLVCFRDLTGVYVSPYNYYYCHTNPNGNSVYLYQDAAPYDPFTITGGTTTTLRNNMIFTITACDQLSTCAAPAVIVEQVGVTTVDVMWASGNEETSWNAYYRLQGDDTWTTAATGLTDSSYQFTGLQGGMAYEFRIESVCTDSYSSIVKAVTNCGTISILPYTENFNNWPTNTLPNCWSKAGSYSNYPYIYGSVNHSGSGSSLYFYQGSGVSYTSRVVLPMLDTLQYQANQLELLFYAHPYQYSGYTNPSFVIGVRDDAEEFTSFTPVDTIHLTVDYTEWQHFVVPLTSYTGTGAYISIESFYNGSYSYGYIDDLTIQLAPACPRMENLASSNATTTSVDLSWTDPTPENTQWQIEYGPIGFTQGTGTIITVSSNPFTLSNPTVTSGNFYVRPICSTGDTGFWNFEAGTFYLGQTPATVPYSYNFEDGTEWNNWQGSTNDLVTAWSRGNAVANNSNYSMYVSVDQGATYTPYSYNSVVNTAVFRDIDFGTSDSSFILSFSARAGGTSTGSYDAVMAFLVDPNVTPIASNSNITSPWGQVNTLTPIASMRYDTTWQTYSGPIDMVHGVHRVAFFWFNQNTQSYGVIEEPAAIDNISIDYDPCPRPVNVHTTLLNPHTATLEWQGPASANYEVVYRIEDGDNQFTTCNTNHITLTDLDSLTTYYFWVRKVCGYGDTSLWSDGISFMTTPCENSKMAFNYGPDQSATTSAFAPMGYSYYGNAYTQTIIDSAYMAGLGSAEVGYLGFNVATASGGDYYTMMNVYLANVPESDLSAGIILSDTTTHVFQQVFDNATLGFSTTGWQIFEMDTTFVWDGHSNVLVTVLRNHNSWTSSYAYFNCHTTGSVKTRYYYQDTYTYTLDEPAGSSGTGNYSGDLMLLACNVGPSCDNPTGAYASNVTYNSATLNWTGTASSYEVQYKAGTAANWTGPETVSSNSYQLTGLTDSTLYLFQVRSICTDEESGETLYSDWVDGTFTTLHLPCFAPSALEAQTVTYSTATLNWEENGVATHWNVHVWNTQFDSIYSSTSHTFVVTGLTQTTIYNVAVSAQCSEETESEYSDTITIQTLTCQPPTGLTVTEKTATTATIVWGGSGIGFDVEYGDEHFSEGVNTQVVHVTGNTYKITGLEPEYDYSVSVRAECEAGVYSAYCAQVDFTTAAQGEGIESAGTANVTLYPNPTSNATTIAISGVNGEVEITLVDLSGRVVMTDSMSCTGDCAKKLEVSGLSQGAYFVRLSGENVNMVKKLIVK